MRLEDSYSKNFKNFNKIFQNKYFHLRFEITPNSKKYETEINELKKNVF